MSVTLYAILPGPTWTGSCGFGIPAERSAAAAAVRGGMEEDLHNLMVRGMAGDANAHRNLLEQLALRLRGFLRARLHHIDPAIVEDLVQETLIAVHTRRDAYDPSQPLMPWVFAIARYRMIDHLRRIKAKGVSVPLDDVTGLYAAECADATDPAHDVAALLEHLPPKQQIAIRLVKLDEISVREAAERTGRSESDIKVSIHRGLKKLSALVAKASRT